MYNVELLYEQLRSQIIESVYIINEDASDISEAKLNMKKTLSDIQKEAKKRRNIFKNKLKYRKKIATRILQQHKESALECKPLGLNYKEYKTFVDDKTIQEMHSTAVDCLDKFNPDITISDTDSLSEHLLKDSDYKQLLNCYGVNNTVLVPGSNVVVKKEDKELSKQDIVEAVAFLESFEELVDKIPTYEIDNDDLIIRNSNILRECAINKKLALDEMNKCMHNNTICSKLNMQFEQAAHILIKASNYNPRNLRESYVIQEMIDSEFYMK